MPDAFLLSCPPFFSPLPFKRTEAKLGIPARFDQMHLNAAAALRMLWHRRGNKTGISLCSGGELSLTRASHLPCGGKVVLRIYNCRSGQYLQRQTDKNICIHHFKSEPETIGYH